MTNLNSEVLVLNSDYSVMDIISIKDAITQLWLNKVYIVVPVENKYVRSPSLTFKVPSVVAQIKYKKIPRKRVGFSRLNVIYRDDMTCQYCGKQFPLEDLTTDHIIPKSRWRQIKRTNKQNWTTWENLVCACKWCNNAKGNLLLNEIGWKLKRKPFEPKYMPHFIIRYSKAESKGWLPFCKVNIKLVEMINQK